MNELPTDDKTALLNPVEYSIRVGEILTEGGLELSQLLTYKNI